MIFLKILIFLIDIITTNNTNKVKTIIVINVEIILNFRLYGIPDCAINILVIIGINKYPHIMPKTNPIIVSILNCSNNDFFKSFVV